MQLAIQGINVTVPDAEVSRIVQERLQGSVPAVAASVSSSSALPRLGEYWTDQGGHYAGIVLDPLTGRDCHLIVGPERDDDANWSDAKAWAAKVEVDGYRDFSLGSLNDLAVARANARKLFKDRSYWSREQHAVDSAYAWGQDFDDGGQYNWTTGSKLRARAFRRLPI